jgi:outer membrane biosynthesis protein TonB
MTSGGSAAQQAKSFEGSCIRWLELPTRGLLAARAERSGTVHAAIEISNDGRATSVRLTSDNPLLKSEVQVAIQQSRFDPSCSGKTMEFIFAFTLEGAPADSLIPPGVRFIPPNRFEFVFRRLKRSVDPASRRDAR